MTRISALLFLLMFCLATAMQAQAQAPAPKPDPEVKKLHANVGRWTFEGENKPGPLGPGGKFTGENTCQMILGGFFLRCQWTGKGALGEFGGLEVDGYDPANKDFSSGYYFSDGSRFSGTLTITGNIWTYAGKYLVAGKEYQYKETYIHTPDLTSWTDKQEISSDGTTWTPLSESRWTKVQPAPKK
jgi:hypothetical protein